MAPHSSTLAWKTMDGGTWQAAVHGVAKSRTRLSNFTFTFHFLHWRRKWQPTPVFLSRESQGQRSLVGGRLWGRTGSDTTKVTQQQQCIVRSDLCTGKYAPNIPLIYLYGRIYILDKSVCLYVSINDKKITTFCFLMNVRYLNQSPVDRCLETQFQNSEQ